MDLHHSQPVAEPQPLLFDSLPVSEGARPRRRARKTASGEDAAPPEAAPPEAMTAPAAAPPTGTAPAPAPAVAPEPLDPSALTNPELRALVQGLPDLRLAFLIVEAGRELRRRVAPDDEDPAEAPGEPPNPSLLRAARLAVGELTGDDS